MINSANEPKDLYCRKTGQPVRMRIDDECPHCGQIGHGLDMSKLKSIIERLGEPTSEAEDAMSFHYLLGTERERMAGSWAHRQQTAIQVFGCGCPTCTAAVDESETCRAQTVQAAEERDNGS